VTKLGTTSASNTTQSKIMLHSERLCVDGSTPNLIDTGYILALTWRFLRVFIAERPKMALTQCK
jgi:hypothetical protein